MVALSARVFMTAAASLEYSLEDGLHLESIDVNIAIADLYRQVEFEIDIP
jgi:hypothetical protein